MRSIPLILKQFSRSVLQVAGLAICGDSAYAQGEAAKGEALFKSKCITCHKLDQRLIGPALGPQLQSETDDKWLSLQGLCYLSCCESHLYCFNNTEGIFYCGLFYALKIRKTPLIFAIKVPVLFIIGLILS
jgi:hypothetical protein